MQSTKIGQAMMSLLFRLLLQLVRVVLQLHSRTGLPIRDEHQQYLLQVTSSQTSMQESLLTWTCYTNEHPTAPKDHMQVHYIRFGNQVKR